MTRKKKSTFKQRLGKCYRLAGLYVLDHPKTTLVHGTINGFRYTKKDFDNSHAWVEENEHVFDPVWDRRLPIQVYYQMFCAVVHKKYTCEQLRNLILKTGKWGAW